MSNVEYWILDGTSKSYHMRKELYNQGARFDDAHKMWSIKNPSEEIKKLIKEIGLVLQFRR